MLTFLVMNLTIYIRLNSLTGFCIGNVHLKLWVPFLHVQSARAIWRHMCWLTRAIRTFFLFQSPSPCAATQLQQPSQSIYTQHDYRPNCPHSVTFILQPLLCFFGKWILSMVRCSITPANSFVVIATAPIHCCLCADQCNNIFVFPSLWTIFLHLGFTPKAI